MQLAVEPHVGSLFDTPERALDLVKRVPGLGFTLDYAHFTRAGISDARIEPLTKFATHLHARAARRGRLQSSLKENTIDFPRALAALRKNKFAGWIALEYVWIDWEHCNEVDIISETHPIEEAAGNGGGKNQMTKICGIYTPNIVPFNDDHSVNEHELRRLTSWLIEKGVHGLYPNGSTGEFIRLSFEERLRVVKIMAEENRGRLPILAGAAEPNSDQVLEGVQILRRPWLPRGQFDRAVLFQGFAGEH